MCSEIASSCLIISAQRWNEREWMANYAHSMISDLSLTANLTNLIHRVFTVFPFIYWITWPWWQTPQEESGSGCAGQQWEGHVRLLVGGGIDIRISWGKWGLKSGNVPVHCDAKGKGGLNQVLLGPLTRHPFDAAAFGTWGPLSGLSVARPWDRSTAAESAWSGGSPLSSKKMYVALGGAGGKVTRRDYEESGVKPKQTDWGETHQVTFSDTGRFHHAWTLCCLEAFRYYLTWQWQIFSPIISSQHL